MSKGIYTIVITGVTKGLGRALTEQYIQLGHMVIGCGRSVNSIESMSNSYPENTDFQVVDISDRKRALPLIYIFFKMKRIIILCILNLLKYWQSK